MSGKSADSREILYVKRNRTAWLTLNRPNVLNALNREMVQSLKLAAQDAQDDDEVRALVLIGAGRAFCAGEDVSLMDKASLKEFADILALLTDTFTLIRQFSKPTVAAINGVAVGGGFELVLACDFRIAATSARLGSGEVKINQPMTNGSTYLLPRLIGEARAKELGMIGDLIDAELAESIGLVTAAVERSDLERTVEELTKKLISRGPMAVSLVKKSLSRSWDVDIETAILIENDAAMKCFVSADQKEGLRAFLEKREPKWSGS